MQRIRVIDTHTGGEPTRVVMAGGPELGSGTMAERRERFSSQFDDWRRAITCEPRGSECMVGALVTPPERNDSLCGVIFFNNVGYLGMCGHGTIGVAVALAHAGRAQTGRHAIDTPVGQVQFELLADGHVRIQNVPSYCLQRQVVVDLPKDIGGSLLQVRGDIAWGGNWFFLVDVPYLRIELSNLNELNRIAMAVRGELGRQGITGLDGAEIDHVELVSGPLPSDNANARNFVLCPGGEYDRSPCGTGTSAKVACLAAAGKLAPGQVWRQASVIGSCFEASYELLSTSQLTKPKGAGPGSLTDPSTPNLPPQIIVTLVGSAFVNSEAELILDPRDPFCMGIQS